MDSDSADPCLTVGIGASAGGLRAYRSFLEHLPADTGMSFVLVQHLDPHHPSMLVDLLAPHSTIPVTQAEDGERVAPNHVYVIPPDSTLTIKGGVLHVTTPAPPRSDRRPIDSFFVSLAEDRGDCAVSIVLSGVGSDGTAGLRAVKAEGGLTLAQAEVDETAMQGMPSSAAATGLVDHIVAVEAMPQKLIEHQRQLREARFWRASRASREEWHEYLHQITALLRNAVGHDFAGYKENTLIRRVQRRMNVLQIDTVAAYISRLGSEPHEADLLFRSLLIGVTQFFRDPPAFDALRTTIVPKLFAGRSPDDPIRIWVPGCATGEEVYSLAILLKEAMTAAGTDFKVQIFGTDLDGNAIAVARAARYRKAADEVSADRLRMWFAAKDDVHCPIKEIRQMCIFSVHNITRDPPFSKLDLISCRNVLIYLNSEVQRHVIRTFHYALKPGGTLFLGPSEGVSRDTDLFALLDKEHRILQRRDDGNFGLHGVLPVPARAPAALAPSRPDVSRDSIDRDARYVIEQYSPVYFVIDRDHNIVRFSGADTGRYLEPSTGAATLNLFYLLRKSLRPEVRAAVLAVETEKIGVVQLIGADTATSELSLIVEPMTDGLIVVAFRERQNEVANAGETHVPDPTQQERDLRATKAQLKAVVSELETYMEESKAATEEMQSVNEELQSANEELETAKEEMQSINEELQTVNAELENKNILLHRTNDDLHNLLDSTEVATLFLDRELRIRNFTPPMEAIFHVRSSDLGRPITDIATKLHYEDLARDAEEVQRTLQVIERDVHLKSQALTFLMRIRPYRTVDNRLEGVVLTFFDITEMHRAQKVGDQLAAIVQSSTDAIISTDLTGIILSWNRGAERLFGYSADEMIGTSVTRLVPAGRENEELGILERIKKGEHIEHYETVRCRKDGSLVEITLTVSPIRNARGEIVAASKIAHDISARRQGENNLRVVMRELSHRSKNLLAVVTAMAKQTARISPSVDSFLQRFVGRVDGLAKSHDLLVNENWTGALLSELVHQQLIAFDEDHRIEARGPGITVNPDAAQAIGLALHELGTNASKYGALSRPSGKVAVEWRIQASDGGPRFHMSWREHGGPHVDTPKETGFGRVLIELLTAQKLNGTAELAFPAEGATWTLEAPAESVLAPVGANRKQ